MIREELLQVAKPILFNTDMVRAILDGRKTVTRRIVKGDIDAILDSPYHKEHTEVSDKQIISKLCAQRYQTGDILYVRETWGHGYHDGTYIYKADDKLANLTEFREASKPIYHPSIHMPKEATRIFLKVTSVLVERLQDITQVGAIDEGALKYDKCETKEYRKAVQKAKENGEKPPLGYTPIERFAGLWDSTIKKKDMGKYGWDSNPLVWVIEFERVMPDERPAGI